MCFFRRKGISSSFILGMFYLSALLMNFSLFSRLFLLYNTRFIEILKAHFIKELVLSITHYFTRFSQKDFFYVLGLAKNRF